MPDQVSSSRAVSALLALCLAALPLTPVEHVHETETPDGHHEAVAHSHAEPHHFDLDLHEQHERATLDHEDSVILTLDSVFAVPDVYAPSAPASSLVRRLLAPPAAEPLVAAPFVERLIHGPPRAPSALRGPPSSPLL
jgi:hypothetical protein